LRLGATHNFNRSGTEACISALPGKQAVNFGEDHRRKIQNDRLISTRSSNFSARGCNDFPKQNTIRYTAKKKFCRKGVLMVFQYGKSAGTGSFCFEQNRLRRGVILPWRKLSPAEYSAPAPASSEVAEVQGAASASSALPADPPPRAADRKPLSPAELHALYAGTAVPPHRYPAPALIAALHSPSIALDPAKRSTDIEDVDLSGVAGAWLRTNSDTTFEQLKCVGFDPLSNQLTAVVTIKQTRGYGGGPSAGSREFVAFWVDWGSEFQYEGTASVVVHDSGSLPASGQDIHVSMPVDLSLHTPAEGLAATKIKVRAVLSWNTPPSTTHPYAQVVWGNSLDLRIAISSHPALHSSKEAPILTVPQRGSSASNFNAGDHQDIESLFTRDRREPVDLARSAASF
jgi:hypothetical protein